MTIRKALAWLVTAYSCLFIACVFWIGRAWSASDPLAVSVEGVRGVSTGSLVSQTFPSASDSLCPYLSVDQGKLPAVAAQKYVVYDADCGRLLINHAGTQPAPIASTTKLMSVYLALKHLGSQDQVRVSAKAGSQIGSLAGILPGETYTVESLAYAAALVSGNDAVFALAEQTGGVLLGNPDAGTDAKIARFVQEMNAEAARLSMSGTHYLDPAGLNDEGRSTAADLAKLAGYIFRIPAVRLAFGTSDRTEYDLSGRHRLELHNSDRLLKDSYYPGIVAGKTGFTPNAAGHCLVTAVQKNGRMFVAVILHTEDEYSNEASALQMRNLWDGFFAAIR